MGESKMKRCTDIFVMIPVSGSFNSHHLKESNVPSIYLDQLNNDSQYECSSQIVETISRKNLGTVSKQLHEQHTKTV